MLGKTHKLGGVCAGAITTSYLWESTNFSEHAAIAVPVLMGASIVGSLLPDIDHPGSKMGRRFKPISLLLNKTIGHRGATHTLLALLAVVVSVLLLNFAIPMEYQPYGWSLLIGLFVGFLSHLILDMLTPSGVPLLAPFYSKNIRIARLTTGKYDWLVSLVMIAGTSYYFYRMHGGL